MVPSTLACGMCLMEGAQQAFPATVAWCVIGPAWYLALCAFARLNDLELWGMGSFLKCFGLVVAGLVLCVLWFGPWTLIPFGLLAAAANVGYYRAAGGLTPGARLAGHSIFAVAVLALGVSGAWGIVAACGPPTASVALRRQSEAGAWASDFQKLRQAEPDSLPVYREIVRRGPHALRLAPSLMEDCVGRIEALGNPTEDVPLLLDSLELLLQADMVREAGIVDQALRRISGCEPEPGSGIKGWREAWNRKQR